MKKNTMLKHMLILLCAFILPGAVFASEIFHPTGIYSSHVGREINKYINEPYVEGALIRVRWSDIEPQEGKFDFTRINQQRTPIIKANKNWSLAVIAGWSAPDWLLSKTKNRMNIRFRNETKTIIPFWDDAYQFHAKKLAQALAKKYGKDPNLVLVYVPQQTANGIEGHFNGTDYKTLQDQGLTSESWMNAVSSSITAYTESFPDKAVAFELHELFKQTQIPNNIIEYIKHNHKDQVGIGVWWLSGNWTYQGDLLRLIAKSDLPVYAQVIGNSSQAHRFPNGDYTEIFKQAKEIGAHYIEVWNYELEKPVLPEVTKAIKSFSKDMQNK